jgi:hypothetical protein
LELRAAFIALNGRMEEAEQLALAWHERLSAEFGSEHRATGRVAYLLVNLYEEWGKPAELALWQAVMPRSGYVPPN